jgi:cyclopropane fatty-acyl-phospholipid synthase-like methyltransferase
MPKRKLILDVGCGDAKSCIKFAKEGYKVIGVEKNFSAFEKARINVATSVEKKFIRLHNKDIREIKLNQKFDGILCNFVLMFMPEKDCLDLFEKFYAKLNSKGELLVKMLMVDDPIAINSRKEKNVFFPDYADMQKIKERYNGNLTFKLIRDKAHNNLNVPHIHSIGILKIVK